MVPSFDDVCDLREQWESTLSETEYHARLDSYIAEMEVGQPGRAELLACSGSHLLQGFKTEVDLARAEERLREAIADGGQTTSDPRVELVQLMHAAGRVDEFIELTRECIRTPPTQPTTFDTVTTLGETLEMIGELRLAHRAYTIGLKHFDPDLHTPDGMDENICFAGRYRVRRALGSGIDAYDRAFEEISPEAAQSIKERSR